MHTSPVFGPPSTPRWSQQTFHSLTLLATTRIINHHFLFPLFHVLSKNHLFSLDWYSSLSDSHPSPEHLPRQRQGKVVHDTKTFSRLFTWYHDTCAQLPCRHRLRPLLGNRQIMFISRGRRQDSLRMPCLSLRLLNSSWSIIIRSLLRLPSRGIKGVSL